MTFDPNEEYPIYTPPVDWEEQFIGLINNNEIQLVVGLLIAILILFTWLDWFMDD